MEYPNKTKETWDKMLGQILKRKAVTTQEAKRLVQDKERWREFIVALLYYLVAYNPLKNQRRPCSAITKIILLRKEEI